MMCYFTDATDAFMRHPVSDNLNMDFVHSDIEDR